jgi:hypothetical protein
MNHPRQRMYPLEATRSPRALSEEPIRIDGMKLQFDEKVALYAVKLELEDRHGQKARARASSRAQRRGVR